MNAKRGVWYIGPLVSCIVALCACTPEPPKPATQSKSTWRIPGVGPSLERCTRNPGEQQNDPDCINVRAAAERKGYR